LKEWSKAMDLYDKVFPELASVGDTTVQMVASDQNCQLFFGKAQRADEMGDHEKCIACCEALFAIDRHFPGYHKYTALSEKAQGRIDDSINTIIEACVYEVSEDDNDEHRKGLLNMYDQLVAEKALTTKGVSRP
jgi:tetratricopeptide (TPR) repeat protein